MSTKQLKKINKLSYKILGELEKQKPELDLVQQLFDNRQEAIDELVQPGGEQDVDKRDQRKILFSEFSELDNKIQQVLRSIRSHQQQQLFNATKKRKAEEGYNVLKKPDISYF